MSGAENQKKKKRKEKKRKGKDIGGLGNLQSPIS
jgi:hypothetical protein